MESLRSILACLFLRSRARKEGYTELLYDSSSSSLEEDSALILSEKYSDFPITQSQYQPPASMIAPENSEIETTTTTVAHQIAFLLFSASENDDALQTKILAAVGATRRWNRRLLEELLDDVIEYVEEGRHSKMGEAMLSAMDLVTDLADDEFTFPRNHPESVDGFIAIVSVGILAEMLGGWVLELLGFGQVKSTEELLCEDEQTGVVKMSTFDKVVLGDRPKRGSVADWWAREYGEYIPRGAVYSFLKRLDMVETD
ncbi:hypothetical protein QBC44DRAFT_133587 [Cladorrhinum sp. PSN332]|nr:hypothetical protein QBC44DRAFT_133587 [Cladorrhinum sp. PSN332]